MIDYFKGHYKCCPHEMFVCTVLVLKKIYNFPIELGAEHNKTESRTTGVV